MAFSERLKGIVQKLVKLQSDSADSGAKFTPEDIKLLEDIFDASTIDFEETLKQFVAQREFLENAKKAYDDTRLFETTLLKQNNTDISNLRKLLVQELNSDNKNQERVKLLKDQIFELQKINRIIARKEEASLKGQEMSKTLLQATTGITNAWGADDLSGASGLMGAAKGFAKGLNEAITITNLISTTLSKMIELALGADEARSRLTIKTGFGVKALGKEFEQIKDNMTILYGAMEGPAQAEQIIADIVSTSKNFTKYQEEGNLAEIGKTAGALKRFGVSTKSVTSIYVHARENLNLSHKEGLKLQGVLFSLSGHLGLSYEETFKNYESSLPVLSRYGMEGPRVFRGISEAARTLGMQYNEVMKITERMDTFKMASKAAGKFNAALGGRFLDPVKVLNAKGGDKLKIIAEALQAANVALSDLHPKVVRMIAKSFGVSAEELTKVTTMGTIGYEASMTTRIEPVKKQDLAKAIARTISAKDKFERNIAALIVKLNKTFKKWFPQARRTIRFIADHGTIIATGAVGLIATFKGLGLIFGSRFRPKYVSGNLSGSSLLDAFADLGGYKCKKRKRKGRRRQKGGKTRRSFYKKQQAARRQRPAKDRLKTAQKQQAGRGQKKVRGQKAQTGTSASSSSARVQAYKDARARGLTPKEARAHAKATTSASSKVKIIPGAAPIAPVKAPAGAASWVQKGDLTGRARALFRSPSAQATYQKMQAGGRFLGRALNVLGLAAIANETIKMYQEEGAGAASETLVAGAGSLYAATLLLRVPGVGVVVGGVTAAKGIIDNMGFYPDDNVFKVIGYGLADTASKLTGGMLDMRDKHTKEYETKINNATDFGGSYGFVEYLMRKFLTISGMNDGGMKIEGNKVSYPFRDDKGNRAFTPLPKGYLDMIRNPEKYELLTQGGHILMHKTNIAILNMAATLVSDYVHMYNLKGQYKRIPRSTIYGMYARKPTKITLDKYGDQKSQFMNVGDDPGKRTKSESKMYLTDFYKAFYERMGYAALSDNSWLRDWIKSVPGGGSWGISSGKHAKPLNQKWFDGTNPHYSTMKPEVAKFLHDTLTVLAGPEFAKKYTGTDFYGPVREIAREDRWMDQGHGMHAFLRGFFDYGDSNWLANAGKVSHINDTDWENRLEWIKEHGKFYANAEKDFVAGAEKADKDNYEGLFGNQGYFPGWINFKEHMRAKKIWGGLGEAKPKKRVRGIEHDDSDDGEVSNKMTKRKDFETSTKDGVLLERLNLIKDMLEEYGKPSPIVAKIGSVVIYEGLAD